MRKDMARKVAPFCMSGPQDFSQRRNDRNKRGSFALGCFGTNVDERLRTRRLNVRPQELFVSTTAQSGASRHEITLIAALSSGRTLAQAWTILASPE